MLCGENAQFYFTNLAVGKEAHMAKCCVPGRLGDQIL
jgi:hypothetical protein